MQQQQERNLADSYVGACMQDNWKAAGNNQNLVCNAKEVYIEGNLTAQTSDACVAGESIQVTLVGDVKFNAERWDPGFYFATDGGDALEGQCALVSLSKGTEYSLTGGGSVRWDKDQGTMENTAGDLCGDVLIKGGGGTLLSQTEVVTNVQVKCQDDDEDNKLDIRACFSWRVKGKDTPCQPKALYPGTTAKCFCDTYTVSNIIVSTPSDDTTGDDDFYDDDFVDYDWNADDFDIDGIEIEIDVMNPWDPSEEVKSGEKNCLDDINWAYSVSDVECAAGEVEMLNPSATTAGTCTQGELTTVSVTSDIKFLGGRYSTAWYVGTDGGNALSGFCSNYILPSTTSIEGGSMESGQCGDFDAAGEATATGVTIIDDEIMVCEDQDGDGFLDVSVCFGWANTPRTCDQEYPKMGSPLACDCERVNIPDIAVLAPGSSLASDVVPPC